ncbi:hypothetical protein [Nannocystis bainbridge]|uniref:Lipoprotein n=1 Tax=Nannocystis bainbridge TaxID=2995303 RepID=A0ABT5E018_9BACT|nr:hypothetical protein [Nannocystis bainbridge]MDC0719179.1 hypothetical protein [Nannocystis bainbridge]
MAILGICVQALLACDKGDGKTTDTASSASSTSTTGDDGPTSGGTTEASASSTEAGSSTSGPMACELVVGPSDEFEVEDPDGCFAAADEAGCLAVESQCTALYGVPMTCTDDTWCAPDGAASVYLGCRPFTICKLNAKAVCRKGPSGVEGFWTMTCTPEGFGLCAPNLQETEASAPPDAPPTCE